MNEIMGRERGGRERGEGERERERERKEREGGEIDRERG